MKNPSRLISAGEFPIRRFFTAAAAESADTMATSTGWRPARKERIIKRLTVLGATGGTVLQALNQCIREGRIIDKFELDNCLRELRKVHHFQHALEIYEWMEKRDFNLTYPDYAVRLELISKTKGIAAAENYFDCLSSSAKNQLTYGALLHCYCEKKMTQKALTLFGKMDMLGLGNCMAFNSLMSLYMRLDKPEKVRPLVEEMKRREISLGTFTYNYWMNSCACLNDIEGVEKVVEEIEKEDERTIDWTCQCNLAAIYVKAGLFEKAESAIRKLEEIKPRVRNAYHFLITLYARTSNLDAVNRVWVCLKSDFAAINRSYLIMLQALTILDDLNGLKKCFEEWESCCSSFDMRLANDAIKAYLKWDMVEDAEWVFRIATERSPAPYNRARNLFMGFFLKRREIDLAMGHMEAAISEVKNPRWHPNAYVVKDFFTCFEEKKDVEGAEKLCKMLKKFNYFDSSSYQSLIQIYVTASRAAPEMRRRVEEDGIEINSDLENFLNIVCTN